MPSAAIESIRDTGGGMCIPAEVRHLGEWRTLGAPSLKSNSALTMARLTLDAVIQSPPILC